MSSFYGDIDTSITASGSVMNNDMVILCSCDNGKFRLNIIP